MSETPSLLIVAEQCGARNSGLGVYAFEVGRRVAARLVARGVRVGLAVRSDAAELADAARDAGATVVPLGPREAGIARRLYDSLVELPRRAAGYGCFYSLDHKLPPRALARGAQVITIHDLCAFEWPDEFDAARRAYHRAVLPRVARRADRVVTVSDFSARRIRELIGVERDRVVVAPNGFDSRLYAPPADGLGSGGDDAATLARFGLEPGYFLFVGRLSPRKNLGLVVSAAAELAARGTPPRVVLVGPPGYRDGEDLRAIEAAGLSGAFRRLEYVPAASLPALYRRSAGLLYPSRCEGFGIPVLEALACGVPAVVARGTSAEEVGGPYATAVDPDDAAALAAVMARLARGERGPETPGVAAWLAGFSWDGTADAAVAGLRPLLRPGVPAGEAA